MENDKYFWFKKLRFYKDLLWNVEEKHLFSI